MKMFTSLAPKMSVLTSSVNSLLQKKELNNDLAELLKTCLYTIERDECTETPDGTGGIICTNNVLASHTVKGLESFSTPDEGKTVFNKYAGNFGYAPL